MEINDKKPLLVLMAPVGTRSGYGERSRDIARALIQLDKYDIKIVNTRWGSCPANALTSEDSDILQRFLLEPLKEQPDIFIQITVPNEFQRVGKFNVGITAGIETDTCDSSWLEGCNKMDLILTSSEHSKNVFLNTVYDKKDKNTGQVLGKLKLEKPVEVLFEGVRLDKFIKEYKKSETIENVFKNISENFCFLSVGHWLPGDLGEDRKNVGGMIKTFYETFKGKTNAPALVLKTSGGSISILDKDEITRKIKLIKETVDSPIVPNVYVVYGDLTDEEMSDLYNHPKVKSYVSFTKGEGFGRPLIEAAITGKPIITTNWSGHLDFLNKETSVLISGQLTNVHPSAQWKGILNAEAKWFSINYAEASAYMKDVFENYKKYQEKSRKTYHHIKTNFSFDLMKEKLNEYLLKVPEFPKQVSLQLPKLKKIELPKLNKIE